MDSHTAYGNVTPEDWGYMKIAREEAATGLSVGGCPIGSALVKGKEVLGKGHNQRVQKGDPIAHGEMDCLRNAGRQKSYKGTTLYTTLSPCMMCTGTIIQFGIKRLVIGENRTFGGNEEFLKSKGVEVILLDDPECKKLMDTFISKYPEIWNEDIGEDPEDK